MLIGITGNIGSGKSHVAKIFSSLTGLPYYDMDILSKICMFQNEDRINAICEKYGKSKDQHFHTFLQAKFFKSNNLKLDIEEEMSGKVWEYIQTKIRPNTEHCIIESATIFEYNWQKKFKEIIVVSTSFESRNYRLKKRGLSDEEIRERLNAQTEEKFYRGFTHSIYNSNKTDYDLIKELSFIKAYIS